MSEKETPAKCRSFQGRAFTTFMMAATFVVVSLSGVVLFFAPNGREARQQGWEMIFLGKGEWIDVHILFGYLCIAVAVFHIWLNRKPLLGYLKQRASKIHCGIRPEWMLALLICIALFVGAKDRVFPVSSLMEWHDSIKNQQQHRGQNPSFNK